MKTINDYIDETGKGLLSLSICRKYEIRKNELHLKEQLFNDSFDEAVKLLLPEINKLEELNKTYIDKIQDLQDRLHQNK